MESKIEYSEHTRSVRRRSHRDATSMFYNTWGPKWTYHFNWNSPVGSKTWPSCFCGKCWQMAKLCVDMPSLVSRRLIDSWCVQVVSLLLRHGADTRLDNSAQQRPVDVASNNRVVKLLSGVYTDSGHLSDDVTPTSADQHTACTKRNYLMTSPDDAEHDVMLKRANYESQPDVDQLYSQHEPLDLSVPKGACTQLNSRNFVIF